MRRVAVSPDDLPSTAGEVLELGSYPAHYVRDVLRMEIDDELELFDGEGGAWLCRIVALDDAVGVEAIAEVERDVESPLAITLLQAIPKGDRWEWILEKATELGVARIVPVETARTVVSISASKMERKLARWNKIIESAARQSTRTVTPALEPVHSFEATLTDRSEDLLLFGHPGESGAANHPSVRNVAIWIGPEGGFSPAEVERLRDVGALPFGLGPRVLRAETAAVVATALLQARWGDLK